MLAPFSFLPKKNTYESRPFFCHLFHALGKAADLIDFAVKMRIMFQIYERRRSATVSFLPDRSLGPGKAFFSGFHGGKEGLQ